MELLLTREARGRKGLLAHSPRLLRSLVVVEFASDAARANAFVMFYLTKCDTGKAAIRRLRLRCSTNDVLKPHEATGVLELNVAFSESKHRRSWM